MKYLSLCSGIEAASVAWESLGWKPVAFCEIEPFPSAVLAHHYPDVPNLRDMTTWREWDADILAAADVLCAGTPCQSFSVAGARRGLDDERGNLTLEFVRIANAIDDIRRGRGADPAIIVWENVPGVLSSRDNAFGCFLAGLAGESEPLVAPGKRWENAGVVLGPQRTVAWRTLDAQYFGLAQRRKRVFVVASAGTRFDPCAVLFESEGVRRDTAPSREAGEGAAPTLAARTKGGGGLGTDAECDGGLIPETVGTLNDGAHNGGGLTGKTLTPGELSLCLNAGGMGRIDAESETLISTIGGDFDEATPQMFKIRGGVDTYEKVDGTKGTAGKGALVSDDQAFTVAAAQDQFLAEPVAFQLAGDRGDPSVSVSEDKAFTLPANPMSDRGQAVAAPSLTATNDPSRSPQSSEVTRQVEAVHQTTMQVRRLTPRECERLQGFPDDYTLVPYRKKSADQCPDGPRYKALGNSWAVPVVRWIGARIQARIEAPSDD